MLQGLGDVARQLRENVLQLALGDVAAQNAGRCFGGAGGLISVAQLGVRRQEVQEPRRHRPSWGRWPGSKPS